MTTRRVVPAPHDVSRGDRCCGWCRGEISATARRDSIYCSKRCRQAAHRFGRGCVARARSVGPLRFAYADPPYPGLARYYRDHPDYAGEVDHGELLSRLQGRGGCVKLPVGRLGVLAIVAWLVALIVGLATSTAAAWATPTSGWQPAVVLLPVWMFLGGVAIGLPSFGLFCLARLLWHLEPLYVKAPKLPVVPRSWGRLSAKDRYAECQREIVRLERELGIELRSEVLP